ncbi:DUF4238 domain-containing protein [Streptacidiphilus rugosus]|uniref:DUF4238 domain-containing protein n=1 Tax=Streptacidiphilus rugosus TaxID=405783 RepID=UPI0012FBF886
MMSVGSPETVTDAASVHTDLARIGELRCETASAVRRQHVVSAVILKRFAVPQSGGVKLSRIDVDHPHRAQKDRGPRGFGWVEDFVPFASGSMEDLWKETETLLPKAFEALDAGEALADPQAKKVLLDTVALHFVRSLRIRAMHEDIWSRVFAAHYHRMVTTGAERVRFAALNEYNLHLVGPEGVEYFANRFLALSRSIYECGALLRTGLEERFKLARRRIAGSGLQIIVPREGEFLIGDSPALSLRYTMPPGGSSRGCEHRGPSPWATSPDRPRPPGRDCQDHQRRRRWDEPPADPGVPNLRPFPPWLCAAPLR